MTPDLDERLDAVPLLAGRPRHVEELPGGLTNQNLKVSTPGGTFVARVFRGDAALLGIDRDAEFHNSRAAAEAGVGAGVVDYRPDLGMLVIDYIPGVTFDNDSFGTPGVLDRVAAACRTLHAGPRFVNDFDMFARQAGYLRVVHEHGFWLPEGYESFDEQFQEVRRALAVRAGPTVPCNNDLLAGNFVDDGVKLWLIDYEYSGNNDACFELGNIGTECDLEPDQLDALVTAYFGRPLRHAIARARLQALVSQYGWALWGAIQASRSSLEFDFRAWGLERFEKAAAGFGSADHPRLLEDVQRDD
ncbi:phosphotransferase [Nocardioides mesophilus]|uniref:Phosphotransferase n=1 Tax=Nocardioides mesophilus TaxID=433659 RepID=A0A7G9RF95_9ACTN|nr:phosphotransferase [Nocardioides mesophilus]QNN54270.1 phosphotransferase [Nocardioides mesophilus]